MILVCWSTTSLLLSTGYSAGFTSLITYPTYTKVINSFQDMLDENVRWGDKDTDCLYTLRFYPRPYMDKLLSNFLLETSSNDSISKVKKGNYGIFVKTLTKYFITRVDSLDDYGLKNLKRLPACVAEEYMVFPMRRNSPYVNILDRKIERFKEHGLILHWARVTWVKYGYKKIQRFYDTFSEIDYGDRKPLKLVQFKKIFIMWLFLSFGVSSLVFLWEILWFRLKN